MKNELIEIVSKSKNQIKWITPVSIFLGITPTKIIEEEFEKDEKGLYKEVKVFNPIEKRYQNEKLRVGKVHGIVLRGGNIYGWASQPYKLKKLKNEYSFQPKQSGIKVKPENQKDILEELSVLIDALVKNKIAPNTDIKHLKQLHKISQNPSNRCSKAIQSVFRKAKGVKEFELVCRMFGGERERTAITFRELYETYKIDTVPEQWGTGFTKYSKANENLLIGYETDLDGNKFYVRLHKKDIPVYNS
jgi:hypothetical protein